MPRASHGTWEPLANRPDPIALLEEQAENRIPEIVPIRYGRMMISPFTFYRGAALLMASDLAATPLSNFGVFASPERQMMFDINDFDETLPGHGSSSAGRCSPGHLPDPRGPEPRRRRPWSRSSPPRRSSP